MTHLLVNPRAGGGGARSRMRELARLAEVAGVGWTAPDSPAAVADAARRIAANGGERLLVAGGDGTLHWAIQGLVGTGCALGVIPTGSGNDVAREAGAPRDLAAAFHAARHGPVRNLDVGTSAGRHFATVAGVGIDGEVVRRVDRGIPLVHGRLVYPLAVVRTLWAFRAPHLRIATDDENIEGRFVLASAANLPWFGGGMRVAPGARADDGLFDLVLVRAISALRLIAVFPRIYSGSHLAHPAVRVVRTRRVRVTADHPMALQADGEILREVDGGGATLDVVPGGLKLVDSRAGITAS